ncbi:MAG: hypothetical protein HKN94_10765 [Acidimicrobiales bacterium]|nr:hypothetical protein [Acidimicrobiales bacterium]RZV47048.1 MAG: hypothetical protein EX269_05770 [Acidimicrobiales bacterium]
MRASPGGNTVPWPAAIVVVCALFLWSSAANGQSDVQSLEKLKVERENVLEDAVESAENVDVATASVDEVAVALDELNAFVAFHESRLADAQQALDGANAAVAATEARSAEIELEREVIRAEIAEIAISNFTGEQSTNTDGLVELALSDDPGEAARFRHLLTLQTGTLSDGLDRMTALEAEAAALTEAQEILAEAATAAVTKVTERSAVVRDAQERQQALVAAAEIRLESRLAEAAALAARDVELATEISDQQTAINNRVAKAARANGVDIPKPVDLEDIVVIEFPDHDTEFKIEVHVDIAEATEQLFLDAYEDGLALQGYGYRPIQLQVDLRAAHCGGAEEDIWHKPVFECSPPTARPGFSKHEQGKAIDFAVAGSTIKTIDSWAFRWLARNAPRYGFENLPGEPWHWSIG